MKESGLRDRVVDVAEELYKFSLLVSSTHIAVFRHMMLHRQDSRGSKLSYACCVGS